MRMSNWSAFAATLTTLPDAVQHGLALFKELHCCYVRIARSSHNTDRNAHPVCNALMLELVRLDGLSVVFPRRERLLAEQSWHRDGKLVIAATSEKVAITHLIPE